MQNARNAALDGLRGIAVLLVLLYHHGLLNSGWVGVDAFFALSGFLITSILRRSRTSDQYWSLFWVKRGTRILPPLILVLLLTMALSFPLSGGSALAYVFSLGDVLAYLRPHFEPLRPLWSLAVEEHFYLLWPFAIRHWQRRTLLRTLAGLIALEPLLRATVSLNTPQWQLTYFLTPFRLDGLALGALLAIAMEDVESVERIRRWSLPALLSVTGSWLAMRLLLGNEFTRGNPTAAYNGVCYSLVAAACSCGLAYLLTHPKCFACRVLGCRMLAWLGMVSYGLYLYQVPVHEAMVRMQPGLGAHTILLDLPVTLALATLSYYGVEKPMMRFGNRITAVITSSKERRGMREAL